MAQSAAGSPPELPISWAYGVDSITGRPLENPGARYVERPVTVRPHPWGAHNWHPMSFSPLTGLVYVPVQDLAFAIAQDPAFTPRPGAWNTGTAATPYPDDLSIRDAIRGTVRGELVAWDPVAGRAAWRVPRPYPWNGGTLATAGFLVFEGTLDGRFVAHHAGTGQELWATDGVLPMLAGPISYEVNGEQYVAGLGAYGSVGLIMGGVFGPETGAPTPGRVYVFKLGGTAAVPAIPARAPISKPPEVPASGEDYAYGGHRGEPLRHPRVQAAFRVPAVRAGRAGGQAGQDLHDIVHVPGGVDPEPALLHGRDHLVPEDEVLGVRGGHHHGLLAGAEKKALVWLAERMPPWVTSDHLTLVGLLSMLGAGVAFALARWTPWTLPLVVIALAANWFGDSLDGTLARVRNRQRPRYGYYVDHVIDIFGALFLLGGLALCGYMNPFLAIGLLVAYLMLSAEVFLATHAQGIFRMAGRILRFGPDGSIPADNPDPASPEWSRGLRNPFDMAFHPGTGGLFASENGPTFGDEVNFILPGRNYGWETLPGGFPQNLVGPRVAAWTPVIAPTGVAFHSGTAFGPEFADNLFLGSYDGADVRRLVLSGPDLPDLDAELPFLRLDDAGVAGKPLDLLEAPGGSLLVSTFTTIWRVRRYGLTHSRTWRCRSSADGAPSEIDQVQWDELGLAEREDAREMSIPGARITRTVDLSGIDQRHLFGQHSNFFRLVETQFDVKLVARGETISIEGDKVEVEAVNRLLEDMMTRIRTGHAPENLATLHHIALNPLKQERTEKLGIKNKRRAAGWDHDYLLRVIMAAKDGDRLHLVREVCDVWFHPVVLMTHFRIGVDDVMMEFRRREGISGIDEKKARGK